jgi:uncharacterized membrane protein
MPPGRYIEIDALRTLAILAMVLYHGAYDLETMYGFHIGVFGGAWLALQKSTASLFLLLSGISFTIAHERAKTKGKHWKRHVHRSLTVLGAALLVTIATSIADPQTYVRFGILHLIGVGILLLPLFARFKEANLLVGLLVIAAGTWVSDLRISSAFLLPLGITYPGFRTVDYFPLLPWFGVMLIGSGIGYFFYVRHRKIPSPISTFQFPLSILTWPGRHSLGIYLWHQPVLLLMFWMMMGKPT